MLSEQYYYFCCFYIKPRKKKADIFYKFNRLREKHIKLIKNEYSIF